MENLMFSLNATVPVFLTMVLGFLLHKWRVIDDSFAAKLNQFVFQIALPVLMFDQLATTDFVSVWDSKFVLFCFAVTLLSIGLAYLLSLMIKNKPARGEFVQAAYRSSAAILGIAYTQNIYGDAGMTPLMIIASVPLYNAMAVVVLALTAPADDNGAKESKAVLARRTIKGIVTNPILLGIVAGLLWSLLKLPVPTIAAKTVDNVGGLATPLGLIAMGASIDLKKVSGKLRPSVCAATVKLVGLCSLFLPLAVAMGFHEAKLIAIMVMLGSPTTVSSFVMARNMGHEGTLTSNTV
ncbi:MAG: AEC family transporter, partial [Clostridia bacterium]|nr:AEC family transporter [Clostridia bacterium]